MRKFTINDDACQALHTTHAIASYETILALVFREYSWNRQGCSLSVELLPVVDGLIMENFSILLPKDIRLGRSVDVAL